MVAAASGRVVGDLLVAYQVVGDGPLDVVVAHGWAMPFACGWVDGKVGGIAVAIGARIAALSKPSEVLLSQTAKDLVAGSGLVFEPRGEHALKGVPESRRLFAVVDESGGRS
jgi:class 3 adenylate cyclase